MKKIIYFIGLFLTAQITVAQALSYNDLGVLFSQEKINGTARFNGMSGAFGALGGDLSAIGINPAGASVFNQTNLSATLGLASDVIEASYYNNMNKTDNDYTSLSQVGGIFVFRSSYKNKGWNKSTFSFNLSDAYDFRELWVAKGNHKNPTFIDHPTTKKSEFVLSDGQSFESIKDGKNKKSTFGFSTKYNNNLYLGMTLNTYQLNFQQQTILTENNRSANSETLDARLRQELFVTGNGVSMSFGVITKPIKNLRLGVAYHSPTWYNLSEESVGEDLSIEVNGSNALRSKSKTNFYEYKLKTPSKITGSVAYVFGKRGLVSLDYTYKNYRNITYQSSDFANENNQFTNELRSVGEFRLGTEWVIKKFYVRGGYHYEASPYKGALSSDALKGFSLGTGYKFKGGRFDVAYQKQSQTMPYNFYPKYPELKTAELSQNKGIITATLSLSL